MPQKPANDAGLRAADEGVKTLLPCNPRAGQAWP